MKIRELLSDESKWTRTFAARDAAGMPVYALASAAYCWCLLGATWYCYDNNERFLVQDRLATVLRQRYKEVSIAAWNDTHSFAEVKALVDELDI